MVAKVSISSIYSRYFMVYISNTSFIALLSAFTISNVLVEGKSSWSSMSSTMTNTFCVNLLSILRCSDSHREHCKTTRMLWPFDKFSRSNVFSKINFSLVKATKEPPKKQKSQVLSFLCKETIVICHSLGHSIIAVPMDQSSEINQTISL